MINLADSIVMEPYITCAINTKMHGGQHSIVINKAKQRKRLAAQITQLAS